MNRMISEFLELAAYSVPSKHEAEIRQCLMEKLLDIMDDDDDVQNVWHNWDED